MGYFSELSYDILEMYEQGLSNESIANVTGVTVEEVKSVIASFEEGEYDADPGDMDGDFDSAMASAGFGTDEDYGYFGDE